jgi:CheY-like chemotaxis protein
LALLKRNNRRLEKLSSALMIADSHKDKFLAMVSHDMRTPLNAVIGYLGLLHDNKKLSEESKDFVNSAQHAAAHLLTVINDLLDFSQIRLGQLTLHPQVINLPLVVRQTFQTLSNQAHEAQLDYQIDISPQVPTWVLLDQNRLSQILINLLGNAIKFTPKGHVHMHVSVATFNDTMELVCRIEDTGIGMSPNQQERIYQPFTQVHDTETSLRLSEPMRGNGLGLAITQSLVKSHQGRLHLQSSLGKGSVFTLYLPIKVSAQPANPAPAFNLATSQDMAPIHVLVVDDNDVNRLVVSTTLMRSFPNAIIEQAANGQQGLDKMRLTVFDLVLIDLVMPDLDGSEVVAIVRQSSPEPYRSVPVIALTANVAQDAVDRCNAAGVNEVLAKPFDRQTLIRAVRHYTVEKDLPKA